MSTVKQAEQDAGALLSSTWWAGVERDEPLPVDPFTLARKLGIDVRLTALPPDESGNITISAGGSVIRINWSDSESRQRFTCAHEIGHYWSRVRKGDIATDEIFVDRRAQLASAGVDTDEIYANQFGAALLMPAHLMAKGFAVDQQSAESLARRFGTSVQAMNLRLRNLRLS